jgi:putative ABC transport system ATP-binding protein
MPTDVPTTGPGDEVARCARLVRIYLSATGETHALRGVEAVFRVGATTAVTGPSGSGKSSLLGVLALRERQSGGELWIDGRLTDDLGARGLRELRRRQVAWVAQRPTHSLFPHLTVLDHVRAAAGLRRAASPVSPVSATGRGGPAEDGSGGVLRRLQLDHRCGAYPGELSGGEQQRLAVAVAVAGRPRLVVADEPTAELDDESSDLVLAELRRSAEHAAVVFATHDHRAVRVADRVLHLRHGVLSSESVGGGPATASIDSTGRVQLPPQALSMFPGSRARLVVDDTGVHLLPPEEQG